MSDSGGELSPRPTGAKNNVSHLKRRGAKKKEKSRREEVRDEDEE